MKPPRGVDLLFFLLGVLLAIPVQAQRVVYVDADATGANNGLSWTDAFVYLKDALAAAAYGDEVWVAAGTYRPGQGQGVMPGDREVSFELANGVRLYGGFTGNEASREERDWEANETVLSGDLLGNDNDNVDWEEPTRQDNSRLVVRTGLTDSTTVLDGFTVTAGHSGEGESVGGGMTSSVAHPVVRNVLFVANVGLFGGGMEIVYGRAELSRVTFRRNKALRGGGLRNLGDAVLTDVRFIENEARLGGGVHN